MILYLIHVNASQTVWYLRIWMVAIAGRASAGPGPPLLRGLRPSVTWLKDGLLISWCWDLPVGRWTFLFHSWFPFDRSGGNSVSCLEKKPSKAGGKDQWCEFVQVSDGPIILFPLCELQQLRSPKIGHCPVWSFWLFGRHGVTIELISFIKQGLWKMWKIWGEWTFAAPAVMVRQSLTVSKESVQVCGKSLKNLPSIPYIWKCEGLTLDGESTRFPCSIAVGVSAQILCCGCSIGSAQQMLWSLVPAGWWHDHTHRHHHLNLIQQWIEQIVSLVCILIISDTGRKLHLLFL